MLSFIWTTSIALSALSLAVMLLLILRRVLHQRRTIDDADGRKRLLEALIRFSGDSDAGALQRAIGSVRPHVAVDSGFEFLALLRGDEHARIVGILVESGLASHIMAQLKRGNEAARIHAAEMLAVLPPEPGIAELSAALDGDRSREVRIAAAISLCDLGSYQPLQLVLGKIGVRGQRSRRLIELFSRFSSERVGELTAFAVREDEPSFVRAAAIEALARTGDLNLADFFRHAAGDPSSDVSAAAIRALGTTGHPDVGAIVAEAMASKHWEVRADAADAAGRLGGVEMIDALVGLLDDEEWTVRYSAGRAIRQLNTTGLDTLRRLASSDSSRTQRMASLVLGEGQAA